jgi:hypothetical protein
VCLAERPWRLPPLLDRGWTQALLRLRWLLRLLRRLPWLVLQLRFGLSHHSPDGAVRLIGRCQLKVLFKVCWAARSDGGQSRRCDSSGPNPPGPAVMLGSNESTRWLCATASPAPSFFFLPVISSRQVDSRVSHASAWLWYEVTGLDELRPAVAISFMISRRHTLLQSANVHARSRSHRQHVSTVWSKSVTPTLFLTAASALARTGRRDAREHQRVCRGRIDVVAAVEPDIRHDRPQLAAGGGWQSKRTPPPAVPGTANGNANAPRVNSVIDRVSFT